MTIQELKKLNKANGGHFFERASMKVLGDTMRSFRLRKDSAHPDDFVWLDRKRDNCSWLFNKKTGRVAYARVIRMKIWNDRTTFA